MSQDLRDAVKELVGVSTEAQAVAILRGLARIAREHPDGTTDLSVTTRDGRLVKVERRPPKERIA